MNTPVYKRRPYFPVSRPQADEHGLEQDARCSIFQDVGRSLQFYEQKLTTLKNQEQGLMQKLLTGGWGENN